jgi:hypothetical protein
VIAICPISGLAKYRTCWMTDRYLVSTNHVKSSLRAAHETPVCVCKILEDSIDLLPVEVYKKSGEPSYPSACACCVLLWEAS